MPAPRAVLVATDEDEVFAAWRAELDNAGFDAIAASSAQSEASVWILRGADDEATLALLAEAKRCADAPALVVSRNPAGLVVRALEAGAVDVLDWDASAAELVSRVRARMNARAEVDALSVAKRDAEVMLELTQALASSLDFHEILYTVVRRIADVVQVSRVSIVLAPEPEDEHIGYVVVASDDEQLTNLQLDLQKYPEIRQVLRTREMLTIRDASTHPVLDRVRDDISSGAMSLFPIVWESQAIGVLFLRASAERGVLSEREVHLCQILANATAVALRNARIMQSLRDHTQQITFARFEAERRLGHLKRYADLFASAAEGIAVVGAGGRLLFANPRAYEMVGSSEKKLGGHRVLTYIHPDDRQRAHSLWKGFARGDYPRSVDVRIAHDDGDYIVCSCSFAKLTDGDGAVLVSFQDVTEQRQTEAEFVKTMEFLESLIDASVDGIVAADLDGNVILFNQGAERIYGYRAEEVVGRMNARSLYPGEGAVDVMKKIRSEAYGGAGRLSPILFEALAKDGSTVPIRLSAAMIYERGKPVATFGIFTDLREKLRVEERLAEAQQKLEMSQKATVLAELAGTAAHELNQPLTIMMACAELLLRKLQGSGPERRAAEAMLSEAERMADIVKKIGKMTKYETKSYVGETRILDLEKASQSEPPTVGD